MQDTSELARPRLHNPTLALDQPTSVVDALRARDAHAWTSLFEEHRDMVYRAALAQVENRELAEDVTGQVFLEAIEGIRRYRDRGKPIGAWLLSIARHRSLDVLRKRRREERAAVLPVDAQGAPSSRALEALSVLTPEQREVIHLRFVEDLAIEKVAELTKRSPGAVKSLQHRALRQLRTQLTPVTHGGDHHA